MAQMAHDGSQNLQLFNIKTDLTLIQSGKIRSRICSGVLAFDAAQPTQAVCRHIAAPGRPADLLLASASDASVPSCR